MTIQVRSVSGNQQVNQSSPTFDSPSSITAGDLLVMLWMINDSTAQTITPDTGWTEQGTVANATPSTRYIVFTKTATSTDATNQGTADYYTFTGMDGADDILYALWSIYDDGADTIGYQASSRG